MVAGLLGLTAAVVQTRGQLEVVPAHKSVREFPTVINGKQSADIPISADVMQSLGPGEFLFRDYGDPNQFGSVNLFLAYFPSQRTGDTIHSPKNCLPGEGWAPVESGRIWVEAPGSGKVELNRYIVKNEDDRAVVLYWYQAHGRITPSEYWAKFYLVADSIRMDRSDGALIRVFVPIENNESVAAAEERGVGFAQQIFPVLGEYVPR
jgi:EpsI family protein